MRCCSLLVAAVLFSGPLLEAQSVGWTRAHVHSQMQASMTYDVARHRVVLFGKSGFGPGAVLQTWEWDGAWSQKSPPVSPPRHGQPMVYDLARRRVVLVDGGTGTRFTDVWEWDGEIWSKKTPAVRPAARVGHALAYDAVRQRVVMSGAGRPATWEWDGARWTRHTPSVSPSVRFNPLMSYDLARQRVVMFGGRQGNNQLWDTWEWNGSSWTLSASQSALDVPPTAMVYLAARLRVAMVTWRGHVWEWSGSTWTRNVPKTAPPLRFFSPITYDVVGQRILLFGGTAAGTIRDMLSDLWQWNGTTWSELESGTPFARHSAAMVYDSARQRVVMFGGRSESARLGGTWEWNGTRWNARNPRRSPTARSGHAMAYDSARRRVVLFGGLHPIGCRGMADTWEWDGTAWQQRAPSASPPARFLHAMAYDAARGRVVLFGGTDCAAKADTWEWNGSTWTRARPRNSPSARFAHAMAYDSARQRVVLFGGPDNQTWEWDGSDWQRRAPATSPPMRAGLAMAYDSSRRRTVIFGVADDSAWEWDGTTWSENRSTPRPVGRVAPAMAYDAARRQIVLYGGVHTAWPLADTWLYGPTIPASARPIGRGCAGPHVPPRLVSSDPYFGNGGFALELLSAPPTSVFLLGLDLTTQRLSVGGGCTLYLGLTAPTFVAGVTNPFGVAALHLPVPSLRALRGLTYFSQGFVLDSRSPLGLSFTPGRQLRIGD